MKTLENSVKSVYKSLVLGLLLGIATLIPGQVQAQSPPKPAVVISIANLNEQLKDVKYLLTAAGVPELNFFAKAGVKIYADGVDFTRNAGVALYFEGNNTTPDFSGFIPVDDLELILESISQYADIEEDGDDKFTIIAPNGVELRIKEKGDYAFFASRKDLLDLLPTEPEKMLGKKASDYNLSFMIYPQEAPKGLREEILSTIQDGARLTLDQLDDELDDAQQANLDSQMRRFEKLFDESESVVIGMAADAESKKLYTEIEYIAKAGSDLAKKMNETKATTPSQFSGFLMPNAAMNFNANGRMPEADADSYADLLADVQLRIIEELNEMGELSDAEFETVETLVGSIVDVVSESLKEGVIDAGMTAVIEDSDANLIGGVKVADPTKIETAVKDFVPMLKEKIAEIEDEGAEVPEITFNLDKETHDGIRFHEIEVEIDDAKAREVIGDSVQILIGFGKDSIYYGVGNDPLPMIKKAKAAKQKTEFSTEINVQLAQFMKLMSRASDADLQLASLAEELSENGGDAIRVYGKHIPNGSFTRFEMEDGILLLIKSAYDSIQVEEFYEDF